MEIKDIPMLRCIKVVMYCLVVLIVVISAIPYALIKGLVNTEYYQEWADFFLDCVQGFLKPSKAWKER